jgi:hypothetical protein
MMKKLLPLFAFALLALAQTARADEPEENLKDLSSAEKKALLLKIVHYKGKIDGDKLHKARGRIQALATHSDALDAASFKCSMLDPTLDDGQKEHILDCEVRSFPSYGGLLELNFGTKGWEADSATISDVTYDFDANLSREDNKEVVKTEACVKEGGKPTPDKRYCMCEGGRYDGAITGGCAAGDGQ